MPSCLNAPSGAQCFPTLTAAEVVAEFPSQCTFWCSVLSDGAKIGTAIHAELSQCTFWCSVLSDEARGNRRRPPLPVSMHLLVLSAFRPVFIAQEKPRHSLNAPSGAQCFPTHCRTGCMSRPFRFQCTFWCSVLSDQNGGPGLSPPNRVSMHLLVLSAFRPSSKCRRRRGRSVSMHLLVLSAFRLNRGIIKSMIPYVSMHLLVLSAFRLMAKSELSTAEFYVSMHLLVLSAFRLGDVGRRHAWINLSQCTFWCSVLSDKESQCLI